MLYPVELQARVRSRGEGRDGRIRTDDFCLPKAALYRAELRPAVEVCNRPWGTGWAAAEGLLAPRASFASSVQGVAPHDGQKIASARADGVNGPQR